MKRKEWMSSMPNKAVPVLGILMLVAMGVGGPARAVAGHPPGLPTHFSGLLSDYTPSSVNGTPIKGAPY